MKVLMIGTPICPICKKIASDLDPYCKEHHIEYEYFMLNDAPKDILTHIVSAGIKTAPALIVYKNDEVVLVTSGEDILSELDKLL